MSSSCIKQSNTIINNFKKEHDSQMICKCMYEKGKSALSYGLLRSS